MYPNCPSEWWSSQMRHSPYDRPRVQSTFVSTLSERSISAISSPHFLSPVTFTGRRLLSHGFGYAATDAMVEHEPPQSPQNEHCWSSLLLRVRIAKGTVTAPHVLLWLSFWT